MVNKSANKILLIFLSFNFNLCKPFKIIEYFENLTQKPALYYLLKSKPINKDLNFIYAPWHELEKNTYSNKHPNLNDIPKIKFNNAFTICTNDFYDHLVPFFKSLGITVLFVCAGNNKKHSGIEIITIPYNVSRTDKPQNKDIFYSFVGTDKTHSCRNQIFEMKHPKKCVIIKRDCFYGFNDLTTKQKIKDEYIDVITRSRFSLCPRGQAPATFRFWESLQAGAIPVLISDNYVLPPGFNWNKCIIKINEKDISKIPQFLKNIPIEKEEKMREQCLKAYALYSGENLDRVIRQYFEKK